MIKRTLSAFLAFLMMSLPACAADETPSGTTISGTSVSASVETTGGETTAAETKLTANLPEVKMNNFAFNVYSSDTSGYCVNDPEEEIGEEINDAIYRRNRQLEEQYGFVLTIRGEPKDYNIVSNTLKSCALAGDNAYQLYLAYTNNLINYAQYVLPINNLTYVDYTMPWWFPEATKAFHIDGLQLALSGCFDLAMPSKVQCIVYNKTLEEELNLKANMYQLVKNGEWTMDRYAEIGTAAAKDLNGDGVMDANDRFGIAGHWKGVYSPFINGMGVTFASTDENGYPIYKGGSDEQLVTAIQFMKTLTEKNPHLYYNAQTTSVVRYEGPEFASSRTMFSALEISVIGGSLRDVDFEKGALPFPKLTEEQERYYCAAAYGHSPVVCSVLPKEQYDNVGILMEAFAFSTYDELLPVYKEKTIKTKSSSDSEMSEMIDVIWDSVFYEFGVLCWENQLSAKLIINLFMKGNDNIVSYMTGLKPTLLKETDNIRTAIAALKAAQ